MKKLCSILITCMLMAGLCGTALASADPVELRFAWWGSQYRNEITLKAIDDFEAKYPHIDVIPEYSSYPGFYDKIVTQVAGGNAPDIFQVDLGWMDEFTLNGILLPLEPFVESGALNMDNVDEAAITSGTFNGNLYGVPMGFLALGVIYDSTLFEQLGIAEPTPDWTWDDFAAIGAEIAEKMGGDFFGVLDGSLMYPTAFTLEIFVRQQGHKLFDGRKIGATEEDLIKWFSMWENMRATKASTSAEFTADSTWAIETRPITTGHAAMDFDVQNKLIAYQGAMHDQSHVLKIAPFPHNKDEVKNGTNIRAGIILSVNSKTAHPDEAVLLMDYLQNDEVGAIHLSVDRGVPINRNILEQLKPTLSREDVMGLEFVENTISAMSPIDSPYPAGYAEVEQKMLTYGQSIAFHETPIEEAVRQFIAEANEILSNAAQ